LADAREGFEELGLEAQLLVEPSVVNDLGGGQGKGLQQFLIAL